MFLAVVPKNVYHVSRSTFLAEKLEKVHVHSYCVTFSNKLPLVFSKRFLRVQKNMDEHFSKKSKNSDFCSDFEQKKCDLSPQN